MYELSLKIGRYLYYLELNIFSKNDKHDYINQEYRELTVLGE